eukprot:m.235497 g.235497  ORF g.235497 m.235497 type:complete len:283 (-) comp12836_c0_seq1:145-993(-)
MSAAVVAVTCPTCGVFLSSDGGCQCCLRKNTTFGPDEAAKDEPRSPKYGATAHPKEDEKLPEACATVIRKRIVRQLLEVLRKYFPTTHDNTMIYWPRCLRDFIADLAKELSPVLDDESLKFNTQECIELMSKASHEINVGYRLQVHKFLLSALHHCSTRPFFGAKPQEETYEPLAQWPLDIVGVEDLREAIGSTALRCDVVNFLFFVQNKLSIQLAFSYIYDANPPITLEAPSVEDAKTVEEYLESFGSSDYGCNRNLIPLEVIKVCSRPNLLSAIRVKEEF